MKPRPLIYVGLGVLALVLYNASRSTPKPDIRILTPEEREQKSAAAASSGDGVFPGIQRVGSARVEKSFLELESTPGLSSYACEGDFCTVMFDPALWSQMEYTMKRDVVAMLGLALAYGKKAQLTMVNDKMTNKQLGNYDASHDRTRIEGQ